ncbi:hypothetical protein A8708_31500 [Paenibacillus oryzisoli]|uniref:Restriction endonuclease type IV Mrr domain-containing protein n=1 Tax=Paenibacillus oryzisoli TaxID=1850517 RepID=A0A198AJ09_9BACL|nr:hypothetical protein A8708_31500 [Paenibacillus oryzisoli]
MNQEEKLFKKNLEETQRQIKHIRHYRTLNELKSMNPYAFEEYIADLYRRKGYKAKVTKRTGDGGKDIILTKDGVLSIVECKRYNETKVGRPEIQKFHSAIIDERAKEGFYITTGNFTNPAIDYVKDKPIRLINGNHLLKLIDEVS